MTNPLLEVEDAQTLAQAIVHTIHEPFLVLDSELRVLVASRSLYEIFQVAAEHTRGCSLFALGDGQWDIPALRLLLETIIPRRVAMDAFEVDHDFPGLGRRTMLLNARKVLYETSSDSNILLAFTDVTERRIIEREKEELHARTQELLRQKQILLQEMEHRVANSLQIIASILMMKARSIASEETRGHLVDAHRRVMSVAAVQAHLHATEGIERIAVGSYLAKLCAGLASSMIGESRPITLEVITDEGEINSAAAVSLGLVVTELVINAIKYAFPDERTDARVLVDYQSDAEAWTLTVSDNGIGKVVSPETAASGGLGTVIIKALIKQLRAQMSMLNTTRGLKVTIKGHL